MLYRLEGLFGIDNLIKLRDDPTRILADASATLQ